MHDQQRVGTGRRHDGEPQQSERTEYRIVDLQGASSPLRACIIRARSLAHCRKVVWPGNFTSTLPTAGESVRSDDRRPALCPWRPTRRPLCMVSVFGSVVMKENTSISTLGPSFLMGPFHC